MKLPCGGIKENIESCTCEDGTVVTPGGQSCNDLKQKVMSCECKEDMRRWFSNKLTTETWLKNKVTLYFEDVNDVGAK